MRSTMSRLAAALFWLVFATLIGCAPRPGATGSVRLTAFPDKRPHYLRYVAFEALGHEHMLLRWRESAMPLKIYLPRPPKGLFEDAETVYQVTRGGILEWADAAAPGVPDFVFVDSASQADIPIVWADQAMGWVIAHIAGGTST